MVPSSETKPSPAIKLTGTAYLATVAAAAAAYVVAGKTSLLLAFAFPLASPIWPPSGIALATLFLGGPRLWPAVFFGAFVVNASATGNIPSSLAIAAGNTLEGLACMWMGKYWVTRAARGANPNRINVVLRFVTSAALATTIAASIGTIAAHESLIVLGNEFWRMWATWWLGDFSGILLFTPLIIVWLRPQRRIWDRAKAAEFGALMGFTGAVSAVLYTPFLLPRGIEFPIAYFSLLPIFWAAIRFGPRETTGMILGTSILATVGTVYGLGPFFLEDRNLSLMLLQSFMAVATILGLIVAAALQERFTSEDELDSKVRERTRELEKARDKDRGNLQRLRSTIQHLPMAALLMDEHGNVVELNETYCQTFGIDLPPDVAKQSPSVLLEKFLKALESPDAHMPKVDKVMSARKPHFGEEIHLKNGRVILRDFLPIHEAGIHRGQLFLYRDVTKERRADKAKSEFMSLVSHQLRTPLTTIRWSLGRLAKELDGSIGERQKELIHSGHQSAVRMAETIDTMLSITRLEAESAPVPKETFTLLPLFREKQSLFHNQFEARNQIFTVKCPEELRVTTNMKLLKEILRNLLQNAIKYTPDGGEITLRARETENGVVIEVEDTGYGIPRYQQRYVFQKFFRGDNIVNRDTSGTGLGLYLVSLLTKALGGTVAMRSAEGQGTTFSITLPREERPDVPAPLEEPFAEAAMSR